MAYYLRLITQFMKISVQEEAAYRMNFWISLLHSALNLGTGILGIVILFNQVETVRGWTFPGTLALLGVYLIAQALRGLFIGPSLDALAGMDGEVWTGKLDYTLLRPADIQFMASFRRWRPFALFDLLLGMGVLAIALAQLHQELSLVRLVGFSLAMTSGIAILYAILLAFTAFVFWSPGVLFTWIFDGVFQMARYPVGMYPGWLRLVLTWVVPVGIITTIPAEILTGTASPAALLGGLAMAVVFVCVSSLLFRYAAKRYASASS
ncbi:MAG: hypothetical protein EHM41_15370 [Chloroflexi bacterium]|nr:MAG: hypothetical protein EHM41_15370 [Chloroflexota bacterium]